MVKKKKPHRPFPFCRESNSALSRHIKMKLKDEHEVEKNAVEKPIEERLRLFDSFKKKGIEKHNQSQLKEKHHFY